MQQRRQLPASFDAEALVLGSILIDPGALALVTGSTTSDDFALEGHKTILAAMLRLNGQGRPVEELALIEALRETGELASVGGEEKIIELASGVPRLRDLNSHIEILREKSIRRGMIRAAEQIASLAYDPDLASATDVAQSLALGIGSNTRSSLLFPSEIIAEAGGLDSMLSSAPGAPTGFVDLDRKLCGGLAPGELVILAARPSMGKTALALNIAHNFARRGQTVPVFSLEMSRGVLLARVLSSMSHVPLSAILNASEQDTRVRRAAEALSTMPLAIDDGGTINAAGIISRCRSLSAKSGGVGLIVVDYLQLMQAKGDNRNQELGSITRALKLLSIELQCPVLLLSQLNRDLEKRSGDGKRPMMSDLRESGAIEQDADKILFLFRRGVYDPNYVTDMTTEVIVAKHRNGPTGTVQMMFQGSTTSFHDLSRRSDEPASDDNDDLF